MVLGCLGRNVLAEQLVLSKKVKVWLRELNIVQGSYRG